MASFSPSQAVQFGWTNAKKYWRWWLPVVLLYLVLSSVPNIIQQIEGKDSANGIFGIVYLICIVLQFWLGTGIILTSWSIVEGKKPTYATLFPNFGLVLRYFFTGIVGGMLIAALVAVLVIIILIPLSFLGGFTTHAPSSAVVGLGIVLGLAALLFIIWLSMRLSLASYISVIERLWPIAALKRSWAITNHQVRSLLWFIILTAGVGILGVLCLLIGLLWALPTIFVAYLYVYKQLNGNS